MRLPMMDEGCKLSDAGKWPAVEQIPAMALIGLPQERPTKNFYESNQRADCRV